MNQIKIYIRRTRDLGPIDNVNIFLPLQMKSCAARIMTSSGDETRYTFHYQLFQGIT